MTYPGAEDLGRAVDELASRLPDTLRPLAAAAFNYWWSWAGDGREVFRAIRGGELEPSGENPITLLDQADATSLARAAADAEFVDRVEKLGRALEAELARPFAADGPDPTRPVAFFCAEYAVHSSLPTYAGGLGVLAGDILKEASDRALPFVAIGILFRQGYFRQRIDPSGWQVESWPEVNPERLPAALVSDLDGSPLTVDVPLGDRQVLVQIWRVDVGRIPLYLLDTDHPENAQADREITSRLYVGDRGTRLAQYAVLGIGGVRALAALGIEPGIVHLNEGHAVLSAIELLRREATGGLPFDEALATVRSRVVFTTHTPVPAGNEEYGADEMLDVLGDTWRRLGVASGELLALGHSSPHDADGIFGLTPFGIRASRATNGVSRRHGDVARAMWQHLFPRGRQEEVPIDHVTNGIHLPTWMAPPMQALLDAYLDAGWRERTADPGTWVLVDAIPDEELWTVRCRLRSELVASIRDGHMDGQADGEDGLESKAGPHALDPETLTVGFARRLAAYKRMDLLTREPARLLDLLAAARPMQVLLSGKAHPMDDDGKRVLRSVYELRSDPVAAERIAFIQNYDLAIAARLLSGCDVWVNLPRPPLEASGTSGMKAAMNGGLNLSVLDGWWEEAYDGTNGWAIASDPATEPRAQDAMDAATLYDLLEREVLPLFYDRDEAGIPRAWVRRMKASLRTIGPRFSATRMLQEYVGRVYLTPRR